MKHPATKELFAYWDTRRRARGVPDRIDIEPGEIRRILGDTFILSCDSARGYPFRLAGTRVCAMFARELKDQPFAALWDAHVSATIAELLTVLVDEHIGVVASAEGQTPQGILQLEMLLLPLRHRNQPSARLIGSLVPAVVPYWLGVAPVETLLITSYRYVGMPSDREPWPRFQPGNATGRRQHNLVVHQGGRT